MAFHSVGRLLFHAWIPPAGRGRRPGLGEQSTGDANQQHQDDDEEEEEDDSEKEALFGGEEVERFSRSSPAAPPPVVAACAEQAVLRLSLILHESVRRFDSRVRAAARSLANGLRSRRKRARRLLARSALLVVDHGLANGSLDGLRDRFPPPARGRDASASGSGCGVGFRLGSAAMSVSSGDEADDHEFEEGVNTRGAAGRAGGLGGCPTVDGVGGDRWYNYESTSRGAVDHGEGCRENAPRGGVGVGGGEGLGKDALQYAAAVHFLAGVSGYFGSVALLCGNVRI